MARTKVRDFDARRDKNSQKSLPIAIIDPNLNHVLSMVHLFTQEDGISKKGNNAKWKELHKTRVNCIPCYALRDNSKSPSN